MAVDLMVVRISVSCMVVVKVDNLFSGLVLPKLIIYTLVSFIQTYYCRTACAHTECFSINSPPIFSVIAITWLCNYMNYYSSICSYFLHNNNYTTSTFEFQYTLWL